MLFQIGDETDTALCRGIKHEFLRSWDAYDDFTRAAAELKDAPENRFLSYQAHNSYSRFLHHLYEFNIGAIRRDLKDTSFPKRQNANHQVDKYVQSNAHRVQRNAQEGDTRYWSVRFPVEVTGIPECVAPNFAEQWRIHRNKLSGHVDHRRSAMDLSKFYRENHQMIILIFLEAGAWWGRMGAEFPDLGEITAFTTAVMGEG